MGCCIDRVTLTSNRNRATLIDFITRISRSSCTGVGSRRASRLRFISLAFSGLAMYSGFINLLMYDVVTLYAFATLPLCLPPLTSFTISNRAAELSLFLPWSDPGFAALPFLEAAPALPRAPVAA